MKKTGSKGRIQRLNALKGKKTLRAFSIRTGIVPSALHNYLKGRRLPEEAIIKICRQTGCSADWLLGLPMSCQTTDSEIKLKSCLLELSATINGLKKIVEDYKDDNI